MAEPTFRAPKRRKIFRVRPREEEEEVGPNSESGIGTTTPDGTASDLALAQSVEKVIPDTEDLSSVADVLRRRKAGKQRKAGIEFTSSKTALPSSSSASVSTALVPVDSDQNALEVVSSRFTAQTGQVADVMDKHM